MSEKAPYFPPPPPLTPKSKGLWRATPPAIFPPILGLFGMGLAWRGAVSALNAPVWISEMMLGAVSLLYVFALVAYFAKILRRPSLVAKDLQILPGRAGLSAGSAAGMLFAATLVPMSPVLAKITLVLSLSAHVIVAFLILRSFALGPAEQRRVTPAWHLSFVGFIIAPLAAVPLGWVGLSEVIYATTLPIAAAIWIISAVQFARKDVPAPLRPLLAIHLAPVCLFGIVSTLLDYQGAAIGFAWAGISVLAIMLIGARYLTRGTFTALWGAFTFPMAAFANLMFAAASMRSDPIVLPFSIPFSVIGGIELIGATFAICFIAFKIMQIWAKGKLSKATNAASL